MNKFQDVLLMTWGTDSDGHFFKRQNFKTPKSSPVYTNFDVELRIGTASNFRNEPKGIVCDIIIDEDYVLPSDTVAPVVSAAVKDVDEKTGITTFNDIKLISLSLVTIHADKECQGNLKFGWKDACDL